MFEQRSNSELKAAARSCMHELGLHRYWKLGAVRWGEAASTEHAHSEINPTNFTIDILIGYHVPPNKVREYIYHELLHLTTIMPEGLVQRHGSEFLQKEFAEFIEITVNQLVLMVLWLLRRIARLRARIAELERKLLKQPPRRAA